MPQKFQGKTTKIPKKKSPKNQGKAVKKIPQKIHPDSGESTKIPGKKPLKISGKKSKCIQEKATEKCRKNKKKFQENST